jgi:hypothetical protein
MNPREGARVRVNAPKSRDSSKESNPPPAPTQLVLGHVTSLADSQNSSLPENYQTASHGKRASLYIANTGYGESVDIN